MASDGPIDVTVSIVNHESRDAVLAILASLRDDAGRRARLEVIVVDNASQDGSVVAIRDAFPEVEVVARADRDGYGANHNVALRRARGRHVLVLNDDTLVEPGAIDALAAHLDAHPEVAVAAPTILNADGEVEVSLWLRPSPRLDVLGLLRRGRPLLPDVDVGGDQPAAVGWATGCALLFRREAMLKLGGFDEGYFMYSEEVDLCTRLADDGQATHWVPGARVVHVGQASTGGHASLARAVEMSRSRRRYWRRHYSRAGRTVARFAVSAQFLAMALGTRLRGRPARAFTLQAVGCWRDPGHPGLREEAEAFNRAAPE
jgi:N-acetylglucosaminyl-diphospho-decaprenol L-rhamnosyltransferase